MGKRGISPLIATVILIAFSVSLGAVVMNLGSNIAQGSSGLTEAKECIGLKLQFHQLNGPQVTFSGQGSQGFVDFVVDNIGNNDVPSLRLLIIGERQGSTLTYVTELPNSAVPAGLPLSKRVPYDYDQNGQPKQVQVIPMATRNGKPIPCMSGAANYIAPS